MNGEDPDRPVPEGRPIERPMIAVVAGYTLLLIVGLLIFDSGVNRNHSLDGSARIGLNIIWGGCFPVGPLLTILLVVLIKRKRLSAHVGRSLIAVTIISPSR